MVEREGLAYAAAMPKIARLTHQLVMAVLAEAQQFDEYTSRVTLLGLTVARDLLTHQLENNKLQPDQQAQLDHLSQFFVQRAVKHSRHGEMTLIDSDGQVMTMAVDPNEDAS